MKRCILLLSSMLLLLCACSTNSEQFGSAPDLTFYYATAGIEELSVSSAVQIEERNNQVFTLTQMLDLYFAGPVSSNLRSPFPSGTRVLAVSNTEDGLRLTLSGEFFTLRGIDMSIASCCLVNTVCDYVNVDQITLTDEMSEINLQLSPDNFLLENLFNVESGTTYALYFPDENHRYLIGETREVTLSENEEPEVYVLRQLILGPTNSDLRPVVPEGTELLGVKTVDGLCTVNFSNEFLDNMSDDPYENYTTIVGIVNTLTSMDPIGSVSILVEGETVNQYGIFSLEEPLYRNASAIGPVRANGTELDVNVYVLGLDAQVPFAVPVRVKMSASRPLYEAVAEAAVSYTPTNGLTNPIPYGTVLLGVSVSGSTCYVDVSRNFIPPDRTAESEQAAVWALVSALTDLDNITSVVLTIEGESSGTEFVDISEPLTKNTVSFD